MSVVFAGLSELKRTMEGALRVAGCRMLTLLADIQSQLRTAHKSRKDAEQRLQGIQLHTVLLYSCIQCCYTELLYS